MVYINENSENVNFPRVSDKKFSQIQFTNQTSNHLVTVGVDYDSIEKNTLMYVINLSSVIDLFKTGQYDYEFLNDVGEVVCSGILQFGGFSNQVIEYEYEQEVIQYNPE